MKISTLSVSAMALAPVALASDLEARQNKCVKIFALGTITSKIRPTTTETETIRVTPTNTINTTVFKKKQTITVTVPTISKTTVFNTITETKTRSAAARTVSPAPITSTISAPAGFTAAANALGSIKIKRDAEAAVANKAKKSCTTTVMDDKTIYVTGGATFTASVTVTKNAKKAATVTNTITQFQKGKTTEMVTSTIVRTITKPTTTTTTTTVTPTVTLAPVQVKFYAACGASNLLDYTLSSAAASNSTDTDGTDNSDQSEAGDGSDDDSDYMRRRHRARATFPKLRLARRSTRQVGINGVVNTNDYAVAANGAKSAYDCCVACQTASSCAGSVYSAESGCSLYTATTCAAGQAKVAGVFTYDSDNEIKAGAGETVSNGKCGTWSAGGDSAESDA